MENSVNEPLLKYNFITPEEYLAKERVSLAKNEYFKGEIFGMSGAFLEHNEIFSNFLEYSLPRLRVNFANLMEVTFGFI